MIAERNRNCPNARGPIVGICGRSSKGAERMISAHDLNKLAREIGRLFPDYQNPERFFENRSEIEHKLKRLAREIEKTANG